MVSAAPEVRQSFTHRSEEKFEEQDVSGVNQHWVRLLKLLQMDVRYERCSGAELFTSDGATILDCLSGYDVHNLGHNHPAIIAAIEDELDGMGRPMLQSHVLERAGERANRLCRLAGGNLKNAFFCSSGSEGVESAIKFSLVHTGRTGMLYTQGAFHGLTCGALSLMRDPFWKKGFGPMLSDTEEIPFGDELALAEKLKTAEMENYLRSQLREQLADFDMVDEIRGAGLFSGIAFKAPRRLALRASYEAFMAIHPAMFGQVLVMRLFSEHGILTQICRNNFTVLKVAPPLIVTRAQIDKCIAAIRSVVELANTPSAFWSNALGLVRRAVTI